MKKKVLIGLYLLQIVIIVFFWINGSLSLFGLGFKSILLALARLAALMGVFLILNQLLLIGRISFIQNTFGHDKLARFHHKSGQYALILILMHFILVLTSYSLFGRISILEQLKEFLLNYDDLIKSFIALILFLLIVIVSLAIVRLRLKYETWYLVHLLTYLAILFAYFHQIKLGGDFANRVFSFYWIGFYVTVFSLFILFRFVIPLLNYFKYKFHVSDVIALNDSVTSIIIDGNNIKNFKRKSGQFLIVRFLDAHRVWQAHPFSLSWGGGESKIRLTIKNSGDFTQKIRSIKKNTRVLIEGPLGVFTTNLAKSNNILLIAGGIGITPIRSLIQEFSSQGKDMVLLFSVKTSKDIIFKEELEKISGLGKLNIHYIVTSEDGRLDLGKIKKLVSDYSSRETYLCGPKEFLVSMRNVLIEGGVEKENIYFEEFSLH